MKQILSFIKTYVILVILFVVQKPLFLLLEKPSDGSHFALMSSPVAVGERTKAYLRELQMIIFSEPYIICQYFESIHTELQLIM